MGAHKRRLDCSIRDACYCSLALPCCADCFRVDCVAFVQGSEIWNNKTGEVRRLRKSSRKDIAILTLVLPGLLLSGLSRAPCLFQESSKALRPALRHAERPPDFLGQRSHIITGIGWFTALWVCSVAGAECQPPYLVVVRLCAAVCLRTLRSGLAGVALVIAKLSSALRKLGMAWHWCRYVLATRRCV